MAILGAGVLAAALAAADWRLVRAEYHAFRLNRAESREEAEPHLEALIDLAGHEPAARAVVAKLGAERQWLTYWVFERIVTLDISPPSNASSEAGRLLPWLREMVSRLERDLSVSEAWAHYLRWWGGSLEELPLHTFETSGLSSAGVQEWFQALLRRHQLIGLAKLSTSGDFTRWPPGTTDELSAYVMSLRGSEPPPRLPLPGWEGPVPEARPSKIFSETLLAPGVTEKP
jgi:hypothetical protein